MTTTTHEDFKSFGDGYLPGLVGVEIVTVSREAVESRMAVRREVMAPNGFLHAASVIALADTSCGYGCVASLPEGREGLHHHRAEEQFPRHRARRLHRLPRHPGPPGPHHPGLGRRGHE